MKRLLALLCLAASVTWGQVIIRGSNSDGSTTYFTKPAGLIDFRCGSGMTCSYSNNIFTMTAAGGAGGTEATQAEAENATASSVFISPRRLVNWAVVNIEGLSGIAVTPTLTGVGLSTNDTVLIKTEGLLAALPASCSNRKNVYIATDAPTGQKVYWCNGSTYELVGGGGTQSYQRLCSLSSATGINATSNTSSVPNVTACVIPAGTIAASDRVECEFTIAREVVSSADSMGFSAAYVVNSTAVMGGHTASANANTYAYRLSLVISNPTTATQTMISTGLSSLNNTWASNSGLNGVIGTINTATTDLTIEPRAWGSGFVDDTIRFDGGSCYLRKAD